jgi:hypothetical protein
MVLRGFKDLFSPNIFVHPEVPARNWQFALSRKGMVWADPLHTVRDA